MGERVALTNDHVKSVLHEKVVWMTIYIDGNQ